jgi:hypothetical protein
VGVIQSISNDPKGTDDDVRKMGIKRAMLGALLAAISMAGLVGLPATEANAAPAITALIKVCNVSEDYVVQYFDDNVFLGQTGRGTCQQNFFPVTVPTVNMTFFAVKVSDGAARLLATFSFDARTQEPCVLAGGTWMDPLFRVKSVTGVCACATFECGSRGAGRDAGGDRVEGVLGEVDRPRVLRTRTAHTPGLAELMRAS